MIRSEDVYAHETVNCRLMTIEDSEKLRVAFLESNAFRVYIKREGLAFICISVLRS